MDWDSYYIGMANYVALKSKDPSVKVGAVLVRPDNTLASVGYNGFPSRMPDLPELYEDRPTKLSRVIHAEMNAILLSREVVSGYTLYCSLAPCDRCAVHAIQAGIKRFVFPALPEEAKERWSGPLALTLQYFTECGVDWKEISDFS